eukprot:4900374-Prymnesium_polylepis.2
MKEVKLDGTARMHSFVDIGKPGSIQWRERSCHAKGCSSCWEGKASSAGCIGDANRCGPSAIKHLVFPAKPETSLARTLPSEGDKTVADMLKEVVAGEMVSVSLPSRVHEPWMLGRLQGEPVEATEADVAEAKELDFSVKAGTMVLRLTKYEPFEIGSRRFVETKVKLVVPASRLRRNKLESNEPKPRLQTKLKDASRYGEDTFELKEADLRAIVAISASEGDIGAFRVECILEHRVVTQRGKQVDQFKTKWQGWSREQDHTWEPLCHFEDAEHIKSCQVLIAKSAASTSQPADPKEPSPQPAAPAAPAVPSQKKPAKVPTPLQKQPVKVATQSQADREEEMAILAAQKAARASSADASRTASASNADTSTADVGSTQNDESDADASAADTSRADASTNDASRVDASTAGASKVDASTADGTSGDPSSPDASSSSASSGSDKPHKGRTPAPAASATPSRHDSIGAMLSLANLQRQPVIGDGNCGYYAILAAAGKMEHCSRKRLSAPSPADYAAQQTLRKSCHTWLTGDGKEVSAFQLSCDKDASSSSWAPANLDRITQGRTVPRGPMGSYANEPALRAMAAVEKVHLVVIDTQSGPSIPRAQRGAPFDSVLIYQPGLAPGMLAKQRSWSNDIAPALLDPKEDTPVYRVILHNGEPPHSASGHFEATKPLE